MTDDTLRGEVEALLARYTGALDQNDFTPAIALFSESAQYRVFLRNNFERGSFVALIDDTPESMRFRCSIQVPGTLEKSVHVVSGIGAAEDGKHVSANAFFALNRDGSPTFDGEYRLKISGRGANMQIEDMLVLLDGDSVASSMRVPI